MYPLRIYSLFLLTSCLAVEIKLCPEEGGIIAAYKNKQEFAKQIIGLGVQSPITVVYVVFHPRGKRGTGGRGRDGRHGDKGVGNNN